MARGGEAAAIACAEGRDGKGAVAARAVTAREVAARAVAARSAAAMCSAPGGYAPCHHPINATVALSSAPGLFAAGGTVTLTDAELGAGSPS